MNDNPDSMIGYDPLAWLNEESEEPSPQAAPEVESTAADHGEESVAPGAPAAESAAADSGVLTLAETLHVSEVQELYTALQSALAAGQVLQVDGGAVERADGASLQLLAAFSREAAANGLAINWRSRSDALVSSAACLGMEEVIWPR